MLTVAYLNMQKRGRFPSYSHYFNDDSPEYPIIALYQILLKRRRRCNLASYL